MSEMCSPAGNISNDAGRALRRMPRRLRWYTAIGVLVPSFVVSCVLVEYKFQRILDDVVTYFAYPGCQMPGIIFTIGRSEHPISAEYECQAYPRRSHIKPDYLPKKAHPDFLKNSSTPRSCPPYLILEVLNE